VPVLEDDGAIVADSTAILEHLERRFPEPPLYPAEPARRVELRIFVDWFNRVWKRPPNSIAAELAQPRPSEERIARLGESMRASLDLFDDLLDGRDHLFGEFSAADCAAFPFLKYALLRHPDDDEPFHRVLEEHLPLGADHPRVERWIRRVDERPRA
jgi:glutathione S-transferase